MRFIDADKLIEDSKNELLKVDFEKLSDNDKLVINTSAIALRMFVKRQPTAYDIDKVVEELKDLGSKYCMNVGCEDNCEDCPHGILMQKEIEIVKAGGKNGNINDLTKIQEYSKLFEKTFDWGCNDVARYLYANAVYEIATHNEAFKGAGKEFEAYLIDNLK